MKRLGTLTDRYERMADAAAFFAARVARGLNHDASSALMTLRRQLDPARVRELEQAITKAAVDPASTFSDPTFVTPYGWAPAFLALVKAQTALDALGIREVPFIVNVPVTTTTADFDWCGENAPAPVSKMVFSSAQMLPAKIAGARVITKELANFSNPRVAGIIQADSVRAIAIATDACAFDPARAAVSDVSPASLTHGATEISASGSTGEDFETDAAGLLAAISGGNPTRPCFVLNRRGAIVLASKRLTTGQRAFPKFGVMGGELLGAPAIVGGGVPDVLVAIDADRVLLADGTIEIDLTNQADVQMDSAPSGPATRVSFFQTSLIAIMGTRFVNWQKASDAVAYRPLTLGGSPE